MGWRWLATEATDPEWKFLARIAAAKGFWQESLARLYSERFGRQIMGSNVSQTFLAKRSYPETKLRYAAILGVSREALDLVAKRGLSRVALGHYRARILDELLIEQRHFPSGFNLVAAITGVWDREGSAVERHSIEEYARNELRVNCPDEQRATAETADRSASLARFLKYIQRFEDIEANRSPLPATYSLLYAIETLVRIHLGDAFANVLLATTRALIVAAGKNVALYDEAYQRDIATITMLSHANVPDGESNDRTTST